MQSRISQTQFHDAIRDNNLPIVQQYILENPDVDRDDLLNLLIKSNKRINYTNHQPVLLAMRDPRTVLGKLCIRQFDFDGTESYDEFFKKERNFKAKINDILRETLKDPNNLLIGVLRDLYKKGASNPAIADSILTLVRQGADPNIAYRIDFRIDLSNNYRLKDVFRNTMETTHQFTLLQLEELLMYGLDLSIAKRPLFTLNTPMLLDYATLIMHYGCHPAVDLPRNMTLLDCVLHDVDFTKPAHIKVVYDLLNYGCLITHLSIFFTPMSHPKVFSALLQWLNVISADQLNTRILDYLKKFKDQLLEEMAELPPKEELAMLEKIFGKAPNNALRKVFFAGHTNALDSRSRLGRAFIRYEQLKVEVAKLPEAELKRILDVYSVDIPAAMQLVRDGASPDVRGRSGYALLHNLAMNYDDQNIMELVQQYKATINIKNDHGYTPYDLLISRDSSTALNSAMQFLDLGVHPDTRTKSWDRDNADSIMHRLISLFLSENISEDTFEEYFAKLVNQHKININIVDATQSTPLQRCLKLRFNTKRVMPAIQKLIEFGADPLTKDERGEDLLAYVIHANTYDEYNDVVKLVFDRCSKATDINIYAHKLLQSSFSLSRINFALTLNKLGIATASIDRQLIRTALADTMKTSHYNEKGIANILQARDLTTPLGRILFPEADTIAKRKENRELMRELTNLPPYHNHKSLYSWFQPFYSSYHQFEAFPWDEVLTLIKEGADPNNYGNLTTGTIVDLKLSSNHVTLTDVLYHSLIKNSVPSLNTVKALLEFGLDFSSKMTSVSEILELFLNQGRYEYAALFVQYGADYHINIITNLAMFEKETKITALDVILKKLNVDYATPLSEQEISAILDLLACNVPITLTDDKIFAALLKWLDQVSADKLTDAVVNHLKPFKDQLLTAMEKEPMLELVRLTQIFNPQYADSALRKVFFAGHPKIDEGRLGKAHARYMELINVEHEIDERNERDTALGLHNGL